MYNIKNALPVFAALISMAVLARTANAQEFSQWSVPENLGAIVNSACAPMSTRCNDQHPAISKDGLSLYFSSDRPGGCGGLDIWVSQRAPRRFCFRCQYVAKLPPPPFAVVFVGNALTGTAGVSPASSAEGASGGVGSHSPAPIASSQYHLP